MESTRPEHVDTRRLCNVARMSSTRRSKEVFAYPLRADYDPVKMFANCFSVMLPPHEDAEAPEVVLRFDASIRHYLEQHRVHSTQTAGPAPTARVSSATGCT